MDVRKTLTDAGYIAVGLGVMGYQRAQARRHEFQGQVSAFGDCVGNRAREVSEFVTTHTKAVEKNAREAAGNATGQVKVTVNKVQETARDAAGNATGQVKVTVVKVQEIGSEFTNRVEPLVEQVQARVSDVPERFVQALEPFTARVRERIGNVA
jgi:hypothetical protein